MNPLPDLIRYGLVFGIGGGATFAAVGTALNYFQHREFSWVSIFGGIIWFITSMTLSFYAYKVKNKK